MRRLGASARAQSGLTIIEMMVAMLIAVILLAGLVTIFASMRRSFSTTRALDQLVNQQQFTSTMLTNAIATAGYYPLTNRTVRGQYPNAADAFPVLSTTVGGHTVDFATAGQFIYGTGGTSAGDNDVVAMRMVTGAAPVSPFDCLGQAGPAGTAARALSVFWVNNANNQLMCGTASDNAGQPLAGGDTLTGQASTKVTGKLGGVSALVVDYGVDTDRDGSVDRFMSADTLNSNGGKICADVISGTGNSSSCWPFVRSVRFTLSFISELNDASSPLKLTRTVRLNNTDGNTRNSMNGVIVSN